MYIDIQHEIVLTGSLPEVIRVKGGFDAALGFGNRVQTPTFGATIPFDLSLGNFLLINATANTAITVSAPINVPSISGLPLYIMVSNQSGGSMGSVTLNAAFLVPSTAPFATPPANGKNQMAAWVNVGTAAAPVYRFLFSQSSDASN
jgi:hypothetical protein